MRGGIRHASHVIPALAAVLLAALWSVVGVAPASAGAPPVDGLVTAAAPADAPFDVPDQLTDRAGVLGSELTALRAELAQLSAQAFGSPELAQQLSQMDAHLQALRPEENRSSWVWRASPRSRPRPAAG